MTFPRSFARIVLTAAVLATTLVASSEAAKSQAAAPAKSATPAAPAAKTQTAIFAGGCFWSMEVQFETRPGILSVVSGYSGGHVANPSYEEVSSGMTGHKESVEVKFDPSKISYEQLLSIYWHGIDPTQSDGQFCDHGDEYQSVIFYRDDAQKQAALDSKAAIEKSGELKKPIATRIEKAGPFYPA